MYDSLARYYDLIHSSLIEDKAYILQLAAKVGGPILELGCGTGRLMIPLARAGHHVTGIDNSLAMLMRARHRLDQESIDVQQRIALIDADIRNLPFVNKERYFSLILLPYNTLLHFQTDEIQQLLRHLSKFLHHEGRLFIDVANPFIIDHMIDDPWPSLENVYTDQETGEKVRQLSQSRVDSTEQCLHTTWTFEVELGLEPVSDLTTIEFDYWYQYPHQLQLLLQHSGYHLVRMLGDYDGSPFDEESDRLLIIARQQSR